MTAEGPIQSERKLRSPAYSRVEEGVSSQGTMNKDSDDWTLVIRPRSPWWDLHLDDLWRYRDLLWMFVRRDFVSGYKQTVLGPLWFFIQPLLTTIMFTIVFSGIAGISTGGVPPILFYLAGTTPWNYFAACFTNTSNTFVANANLFGKVYFPRLILPLSIVVSNLMQFMVQFLLFLGFLIWYRSQGVIEIGNIFIIIVLTPALLAMMAVLGLAMGMTISSLTTKYRDLTRLVSFGIQLMMYATPVIYPLSVVPDRYRWYMYLNPMCAIIESFRAAFLGGQVQWYALLFAVAISMVLLVCGAILFKKTERSFLDTV